MNATTTAKSGAKIDNTDKPIAAPVSASPITGFAMPAVVTVEAARVAADIPLTAVAVPPPAPIASAHVKAGLMSVKFAAIANVPATPAKGKAILSNKLSTTGTR